MVADVFTTRYWPRTATCNSLEHWSFYNSLGLFIVNATAMPFFAVLTSLVREAYKKH